MNDGMTMKLGSALEHCGSAASFHSGVRRTSAHGPLVDRAKQQNAEFLHEMT
jgi:hypothetical protein